MSNSHRSLRVGIELVERPYREDRPRQPSRSVVSTSLDGYSKRTGWGAGGFTLIEIMVALAVLAIAALALVRLEAATLRGSGLVDSVTLAQIVARNVAVEAVTDAAAPAAGRAEGMEENGGRRWRWTRDVRRIGDGQVLRIDVAVADVGGQVLGRLTMVRPPPRAAPAAPS